MYRVKKIITIFLVCCFVAGLSGCGLIDRVKQRIKEETSHTATVDNTTEKEITNSISVGILDFDTFNPLLTKSQTVKECMEFVYEPLFDVDEKLRPVPILAKDYTVSPDGRTIDINLQDNVLWQDGSAFTAYDVAYTIKQIRSGITEYTGLLDNMADYMATGDHSLRIVLNYSVPDFVSLLTFPIVQYQTDMKLSSGYIPLGTGPFMYSSQLSVGKMSFSAYENYHKGRPQIDNLYVYTAPDIYKYETMFEASEIDLITDKSVDLTEYTPRGSIRNNEYVTNKMTFVGYNFRNELLTGTETRQGLSKLIDKEAIVNSIIYSKGVACDVPLNPSSIYYYDTNTKFKADEVVAAQHLGNDGWGVNQDGQYVRNVNGEKQYLNFEILTNSDSTEKVKIAEEIAENFTDFGIGVTVNALPYNEYTAKITTGDYDIMIGEIEVGANLDLSPLVSSAGNYFGYSNRDLDTIIGQIGMTGDEEQKKELFRQYGDIIVKDMPFAPLFYRKGNVLSGAKIKSDIVPTIGRLFRNIETWSVK